MYKQPTYHSGLTSRLKHPSSLHSSFSDESATSDSIWPRRREESNTNSILENIHFPFFIATLIKPFGSSPSKSVFFNVKTKPVSWYTSDKGSSWVSDRVRLSSKISPTFSLYVSRATSRSRLQLALDHRQLLFPGPQRIAYSDGVHARIHRSNTPLLSMKLELCLWIKKQTFAGAPSSFRLAETRLSIFASLSSEIIYRLK